MREPREVFIFVRRGSEFLVLHRRPTRGDYWHVVAGAVEPGESDADAARRELREETGLDGVAVIPLELRYTYPLEKYPDLRSSYAETVSEVTVECFYVRAPPHWDPALNAEHDEHLWCSPGGAVALLHWPETREAVLKIADEDRIHHDANTAGS